MKASPLISIIITCYNYGKYLDESVKSVTSQSYENVEIIIINDGSTDTTYEVCKRLEKSSKKIRYINQDNQGIILTRNKGLREAMGEYIIFLDADDCLDANYLHNTVSLAEKSNADIVYTDYKMFGVRNDTSNFPDYNLEELKNHNYIHISSLIRKASVGSIQFDEDMRDMTHEDWDFFLALCMNGSSAIKSNDTYLMYRIHSAGRNNRMENDIGRMKLAEVYVYITSKYPGDYPRGTSYLAGRVYADWYIQASYRVNGLIAENGGLKSNVAELTGENKMLKDNLELIQNSKYYKTYTKLRNLKAHIKNGK